MTTIANIIVISILFIWTPDRQIDPKHFRLIPLPITDKNCLFYSFFLLNSPILP